MRFLLWALVLVVLALKSYASPIENRRFKALGMLESGEKDFAVGAAGEVSRYQILPRYWYVYSDTLADATNEVMARGVAKHIISNRVDFFKRYTGRAPTDYEWALLWHCPAVVLDHYQGAHTATIRQKDYAKRFEALMSVYK